MIDIESMPFLSNYIFSWDTHLNIMPSCVVTICHTHKVKYMSLKIKSLIVWTKLPNSAQMAAGQSYIYYHCGTVPHPSIHQPQTQAPTSSSNRWLMTVEFNFKKCVRESPLQTLQSNQICFLNNIKLSSNRNLLRSSSKINSFKNNFH